MNPLQFNADTKTLIMTEYRTEKIAHYLEGVKAILYDENDPSCSIIERYARENNIGVFALAGDYGEFPDFENMTSVVNAITDGIILRRSDSLEKAVDDIIEYYGRRGIEITVIMIGDQEICNSVNPI